MAKKIVTTTPATKTTKTTTTKKATVKKTATKTTAKKATTAKKTTAKKAAEKPAKWSLEICEGVTMKSKVMEASDSTYAIAMTDKAITKLHEICVDNENDDCELAMAVAKAFTGRKKKTASVQAIVEKLNDLGIGGYSITEGEVEEAAPAKKTKKKMISKSTGAEPVNPLNGGEYMDGDVHVYEAPAEDEEGEQATLKTKIKPTKKTVSVKKATKKKTAKKVEEVEEEPVEEEVAEVIAEEVEAEVIDEVEEAAEAVEEETADEAPAKRQVLAPEEVIDEEEVAEEPEMVEDEAEETNEISFSEEEIPEDQPIDFSELDYED